MDFSVPVSNALWIALSNENEPLPEDFEPTNLKQVSARMVGVHLVTSRAVLLREDALGALYQLLAAAEADGLELYVRQGYRSYSDEARRYESLKSAGGAVQKPGESSYRTGLSVTLVDRANRSTTLTTAFDQTEESRWLQANAARFGFVLRYPKGKDELTGWSYEPWHYRYVGTELARVLTDNGLCLEEFRAVYDQYQDFDLDQSQNVTMEMAVPLATKAPAVQTEKLGEGENAMAEDPADAAEMNETDDAADEAELLEEHSAVVTATPAPTAAPTEVPAAPAPTVAPTAVPATPAPTAEPTAVPVTPAPTAAPAVSVQTAAGAEYLLRASAADPLPADYVPARLMQVFAQEKGVHLVTSRAVLVQEEALKALYEMLADAHKAGLEIYIRQGYRSYADESRRYDSLISYGDPAQKPGESSYQTGLSLTLVSEDYRIGDLDVEFAKTKVGQWLLSNCYEYGFVLRYPEGKDAVTGWTYEPWHFRYAGKEAARIMNAEGLCLEEYLDRYNIVPVLLSASPEAENTQTAVIVPLVTPAPTPKPVPTVNPAVGQYSTGEYGEDGDYEIQLFTPIE